jgi:hypothetical protein
MDIRKLNQKDLFFKNPEIMKMGCFWIENGYKSTMAIEMQFLCAYVELHQALLISNAAEFQAFFFLFRQRLDKLKVCFCITLT